MTSPFGTFDQVAQLPVRIRLQSGESTDSYIRRLARANHLKPSYLHGFLTASLNWFGKPRLERLAAATGRSPEVLERVLADAQPSRPPRRRGTARKPKSTDKPALYRRIRDDAEAEGLSMRALVRRHHVGLRTVRAALENPDPRPRKPLPRRSSVIDPVQHLIDAMIEAGRTPKDIWAALMDEHDISVSYGRIRDYVHMQTGPAS